MEPLSSPTIAVMVHRAYADRVRDKLLGKQVEWARLGLDEATTRSDVIKKRPRSSSCRRICTPDIKGGRKHRRGYALLVLETSEVDMDVANLPPIARQNISSAYILTHQMTMTTTTTTNLGAELWKLMKDHGFDVQNSSLRVECFPKEDSERICLGLQTAATEDKETSSAPTAATDDNDMSAPTLPFDGLVRMTRSASKCTHVLNVIRDTNDVWAGLVTCESFRGMHLNDNAARDVIIESTDPRTGENSGDSDVVDSKAPVSRAYYKLHQVWQDGILNESIVDTATASAVDLGAAPGGWTQVLKHIIGMKRVVAVDPGIVAKRILDDDSCIQHVVAELSSETVATALRNVAPLSLLVCDASTDSNEVLDKILVLQKQLSGCWTLPCAWVVTLKLPYKTAGSLDRNLTRLRKSIPQQLQTAAELMYGDSKKHVSPTVKFTICHLIANSDSERTLIAVFEEKTL